MITNNEEHNFIPFRKRQYCILGNSVMRVKINIMWEIWDPWMFLFYLKGKGCFCMQQGTWKGKFNTFFHAVFLPKISSTQTTVCPVLVQHASTCTCPLWGKVKQFGIRYAILFRKEQGKKMLKLQFWSDWQSHMTAFQQEKL